MKQKLILVLFGALTTLAHAQAPSGYLCVADKATGFAFDKGTKQWNQASFRTESKYLISPSTFKGYAWEVKRVGQQFTSAMCKDNFNSVGNLFCGGLGTEFKFSSGSLRYMSAYLIGYWPEANPKAKSDSEREEGSDTPYIEIGKCSPF